MAINNLPKTGIGSTIGIGDAAITGTPGETEFLAATYVVLPELVSFQEPGRSFSEVTFTRLNDGLVRRSKGAKDLGSVTVTCAYIPNDPARDAFEAALDDTAGQYPFEIEYKEDGTTTSGFAYFVGRVMSSSAVDVSTDATRTIQYTIAVLQEPVFVDAT